HGSLLCLHQGAKGVSAKPPSLPSYSLTAVHPELPEPAQTSAESRNPLLTPLTSIFPPGVGNFPYLKRSSAFHFRTAPGKFPTSPREAKPRLPARSHYWLLIGYQSCPFRQVLCAGAERSQAWTERRRRGATGSVGNGIPIKSTMDNPTTTQYANLMHNFILKARSTVREIDPQNDLTFLRIRSKKNEIMVAPDKDYFLIVIQNPTE
uniref:Dynein light chain roadblock-type 1 n=1 Tax=Canis lupus dingo TaxID=286419 RepID=A0A8C0JWC0_CANLU